MPSKVISVEVKGLHKILENLQKASDKALHAIAAELYTEAEATMKESKLEVPVDTGALQSSGMVAVPEITATGVVVEMGYGGPAGPGHEGVDVGYAYYVHEDLNAHHPNGKAKYLEEPFNRRAAGLTERVGNGVRRRLG